MIVISFLSMRNSTSSSSETFTGTDSWMVKRRDNNRGMLSIDLLRTVMQTDHLEPIDITTHGIFRTQFHDKFKSTDFKTLEFPPKYTSLFHPPRDGDGPYIGEGETTVEEEGDEEEDAEESVDDSEKAKKIIVKCRSRAFRTAGGRYLLTYLSSGRLISHQPPIT